MSKKKTNSRLSSDMEAVRRFTRSLEKYVNKEEFRPRRGYADEWVLLALVSKAIWVGRAVCSLVKAGYPEESFWCDAHAGGHFFTVRFICNKDSDTRARRFADYFAKEQESWLQIRNEYFPKTRLRSRPDQARLNSLAKQFKDPHRWSGHDTRYMAEEADTVEKDENGKPAKYSFDYKVIFGWTSRYVHPSSSTIDSHIGAEGAFFKIASSELAGMGEGDLALFNVTVYLRNICVYVFRQLGTGLSSRIGNKGLALLNSLMVSSGKNRRARRAKLRQSRA